MYYILGMMHDVCSFGHKLPDQKAFERLPEIVRSRWARAATGRAIIS